MSKTLDPYRYSFSLYADTLEDAIRKAKPIAAKFWGEFGYVFTSMDADAIMTFGNEVMAVRADFVTEAGDES